MAGHDARFVQEQVGHEHASTTSIYTCVSSDYRTSALRRHLDATTAAARHSGRNNSPCGAAADPKVTPAYRSGTVT